MDVWDGWSAGQLVELVGVCELGKLVWLVSMCKLVLAMLAFVSVCSELARMVDNVKWHPSKRAKAMVCICSELAHVV